jgi:hypothetical protein
VQDEGFAAGADVQDVGVGQPLAREFELFEIARNLHSRVCELVLAKSVLVLVDVVIDVPHLTVVLGDFGGHARGSCRLPCDGSLLRFFRGRPEVDPNANAPNGRKPHGNGAR